MTCGEVEVTRSETAGQKGMWISQHGQSIYLNCEDAVRVRDTLTRELAAWLRRPKQKHGRTRVEISREQWKELKAKLRKEGLLEAEDQIEKYS